MLADFFLGCAKVCYRCMPRPFPFDLIIHRRWVVAGYYAVSINILPERKAAASVSIICHFGPSRAINSPRFFSQNRHILRLNYFSRGVFWAPRLRNLAHGRRRWETWMGVDFHSGTSRLQTSNHLANSTYRMTGRPLHFPLWHSFILPSPSHSFAHHVPY